MIRQEQLAEVIDAQKVTFLNNGAELVRDVLPEIPVVSGFATIITGVRRCGKSTLLLQLLKNRYKDALYINFEDIRLTGFVSADFSRLHQEIVKRKIPVLFLDEIQLIDKWEILVNQLLREKYTIFVTGSNASMLSRELGTHLTGRHISIELFPFSYHEFTLYKDMDRTEDSLASYLYIGGFPDYAKNGESFILTNLMEDILIRDIAVRYGIRDVNSLKQLALYLITHAGSRVSANRLTGIFGIKSSTTLLEYFSYFQDAYLIEFMPQFSYSLKAQARNPKKVYAIDPGLITVLSASYTEDIGHRFENLVYLHLRRSYKDLFYFNQRGECDFIVFDKGKAVKVIQVCYLIGDANFEREYDGLLEAMSVFNLSEGVIVTMNQKDRFEKDGSTIDLIPAYEFMAQVD